MLIRLQRLFRFLLLHQQIAELLAGRQCRRGRDGVLRRRGFERDGFVHELKRRTRALLGLRNPRVELQSQDTDVARKQCFTGRGRRRFQRLQSLRGCLRCRHIAQSRCAQTVCKHGSRFRPAESIPIEIRRLSRLDQRSFVPGMTFERISRRRRRRVERSLERWLDVPDRLQSLDLLCRGLIVTLLQIRVDQVFDCMRELVPHIFTLLASRILQRSIGRAQITADDAVPIPDARIYMSGHVQRVGIVGRELRITIRDLE